MIVDVNLFFQDFRLKDFGFLSDKNKDVVIYVSSHGHGNGPFLWQILISSFCRDERKPS